MVLSHEERYELSKQLINTVHFMITSKDHHMIVKELEILEGLAEEDGNVPFLVDLPVNTQVIVNALLLGDLQVSEGVLTVHRMLKWWSDGKWQPNAMSVCAFLLCIGITCTVARGCSILP